MELAAFNRAGAFRGKKWVDIKKIWNEVKGGGSP
jgi:hypothetical protein